MSSTPHNTGSYTIKKGDTVFCEGRKVQSLNLLLQGKLNVFISHTQSKSLSDDVFKKSFRIFDIDQNIFMEANDLFLNGNHTLSCRAGTDCNLFGCDARTPEQAMSLINSQRDYGAYIMNSLCTLINNTHSSFEKILALRNSLKCITDNLLTFFWVLREKYGFEYVPASVYFQAGQERLISLRQRGIVVPLVFSQDFTENDCGDSEEGVSDDVRIEYYSHLYTLPSELRKSFFGTDMSITQYHTTDASKCLESLLLLVKQTFRETDEYFKKLYSEEGENICSAYMQAAGEIGAAGYDNSTALNAIDYIILKISEILSIYETEYSHPCQTDLTYLECSYNNIKAGYSPSMNNGQGAKVTANTRADYEMLPEELKDSAKRILEFAGISEENSDMFLMNLTAFRNLKDRLSTDDTARNIRNDVSSLYFEIYEAVLKKAVKHNDNSRLISMFLNYGYMDEKLLNPEQVLTLYKLAGRDQSTGFESVHSMREWLSRIYSMKKDPSINEFGQDYFDVFREMKKYGQVSDKDKPIYDNNLDARLTYELQNMVKTNHKLCQGQISLYFPILHKDMITRDLEKSYVTKEALTESLKRILEIDYSAFYREVHFRDASKGIEKELVMKPITPDIILIPVFGSRAMMWQEITGRNRSTPGRFLIPVFTDENIDDIMTRLVGNFRWELCRTMMGSAWNDVSQSSLTSEYTDYIQFFKKNRDLSDEAREKVKAQITKYHNRMRDIFTADYELWLNNEAKGNIRLNKIARSILFRYCTFSKPIREQLDKQPIYAEMSTQLRNQRAKTTRELESRYGRYAKNGPLDLDLEHNLVYYRDL